MDDVNSDARLRGIASRFAELDHVEAVTRLRLRRRRKDLTSVMVRRNSYR